MKLTGIGDNKRAWLGGGAVVAVLIVLAGWFLVIDPELSAASANRDQTASSNQQNQALQIRNNVLQEKNNDQGALQAGLAAALAQLPSDGALPAFTRQLSAQANAAGVVLTGVIIGAATPVVATGGQTAAAAGLGSTAATTSAAAPATTAAAAPPATSAGLVQMTITLNATGLGRDDLAFLRAIQWNGPRRALVTAVQLVPTAPTGATSSSPTTSSPTTARPTTSTAKPTTGSKKAGSATAGSKATSSPTTSSPTTVSTVVDPAMAGIDGPCTLTVSLTIFSAPLSPSAQADLDKLLSGK